MTTIRPMIADLKQAAATREQNGRSHAMHAPGDLVRVTHPVTQAQCPGVVVSCVASLHCSVVEVRLDGATKSIKVAGDRVTRRAAR